MTSREGMRKRGAVAAEDPKRYQNTADAARPARKDSRSGRKGKQPAQQQAAEGEGWVESITGFFTKVASWFRAKTVPIAIDPTQCTMSALDVLTAKAGTPYDSENEVHEAMLLELWSLLILDTAYERKSKRWSDIGFQGKDPATDFRGQGLLGLHNLLHFSQNCTAEARDVLLRPHMGFPLALAAINISAFLTELLRKQAGLLGNPLFERTASDPDRVLRTFNELFCLIFSEFEAHYSTAIGKYLDTGGKPEFTIMQFNPIREAFCGKLNAQIAAGRFEAAFTDNAKDRAADEGRVFTTGTPGGAGAAPDACATTAAAPEGQLIDLGN